MILKKTPSVVDNEADFHNKRYQRILQIQKFVQEGCSNREIARRMGISRNTVAKYKTYNPWFLCQYGIRQSKLDGYREFIVQCLRNGFSKSKTVKAIYEQGYDGGTTNALSISKRLSKSILNDSHHNPM